jgi:hypothetical protein
MRPIGVILMRYVQEIHETELGFATETINFHYSLRTGRHRNVGRSPIQWEPQSQLPRLSGVRILQLC